MKKPVAEETQACVTSRQAAVKQAVKHRGNTLSTRTNNSSSKPLHKFHRTNKHKICMLIKCDWNASSTLMSFTFRFTRWNMAKKCESKSERFFSIAKLSDFLLTPPLVSFQQFLLEWRRNRGDNKLCVYFRDSIEIISSSSWWLTRITQRRCWLVVAVMQFTLKKINFCEIPVWVAQHARWANRPDSHGKPKHAKHTKNVFKRLVNKLETVNKETKLGIS